MPNWLAINERKPLVHTDLCQSLVSQTYPRPGCSDASRSWFEHHLHPVAITVVNTALMSSTACHDPEPPSRLSPAAADDPFSMRRLVPRGWRFDTAQVFLVAGQLTRGRS